MHQSFNRVLKRIQTEALKQINNSKKKRRNQESLNRPTNAQASTKPRHPISVHNDPAMEKRNIPRAGSPLNPSEQRSEVQGRGRTMLLDVISQNGGPVGP